MSLRRTVGAVGALLTCPCHAVPLALLFAGGTAGGAWMTRHLPVVLLILLALFLLSLWLLFRSEPGAARADGMAACGTCGRAGTSEAPPDSPSGAR